jgi:hypothetical protein
MHKHNAQPIVFRLPGGRNIKPVGFEVSTVVVSTETQRTTRSHIPEDDTLQILSLLGRIDQHSLLF